MKKWREFELIVAKIQRELTQDATVLTNQRITGKSGTKRQIDVLIQKKLGLYEILIVIECKNYSKPVGVKEVGAFANTIEDIGTKYGVLISRNGFTKGAKQLAHSNSIILQTYREAENKDWKTLMEMMLGSNCILSL